MDIAVQVLPLHLGLTITSHRERAERANDSDANRDMNDPTIEKLLSFFPPGIGQERHYHLPNICNSP